LSGIEKEVKVMNATEGIAQADGATNKKEHYRVHRGEPGRNIITILEHGNPAIEKFPLALASPPSSLLPSLIEDQGEGKPVTLSLYDEIAHWRASLVLAFSEEESNRTGLKRELFNRFLKGYNSGSLLPDIYKKLGPISDKTLYRWRKDFAAQGIDGLVPQYGGVGQSKITDHEKNILLALLLHQNRLKVAYAITLTKEFLKKREIESPSSSSTLRRFADEFKKEHYDIWILHREGEKALNDKVLPYAERDWRRLEVGEGLVADGHRLNFQVIHPVTGKPCRATFVLFEDGKSSYPLGWEIMIEENIQCVASAFRNAILALGKYPKWIYLDNGKAFKAKTFTEDVNFEDTELPGMFARLSKEAGHRVNYHFALPYNAQAKPIERKFRTFNEEVERLMPSYIGASINDKPAWTKRNEKFARSLHDPWVPTIQETDGLIRAWRDRYAERPSRGRDGLRPIDIFNEGKGPGVDPAKLYYLMMEREIKTIHRNGLTWLGWHWYDEAMYGLKDKIIIKYSLSDLSQIAVFHKNEFLCWAKPVEPVHPMASESDNPKDMEAVKDVLRLKKKVRNTTLKLCDLLDSKAAGQIDWSRTKSSEIAETIQKIEAEKVQPQIISPFVDEPEPETPVEEENQAPVGEITGDGNSLSSANLSPPNPINTEHPSDGANKRPWFQGDYDKYDWLMKQDCFGLEDRDFITRFREMSSLYRSMVFDDDEELDRKVRLYEERNERSIPEGET
jgi:putative transposase